MIQADTERSGSSEQSPNYCFGCWYPVEDFNPTLHGSVFIWLEEERGAYIALAHYEHEPRGFVWRVIGANEEGQWHKKCVKVWSPALLPPLPWNGDRPDEAESDAGRLNQLHSIRDTTIEDCARVALADTSFDMLQDFGMQSTCAQVRENIAADIRALKDKNPREE